MRMVVRLSTLVTVLFLAACGGGGGGGGGAPATASPAPSAPANASELVVASLPANTKCPSADNIILVYAGNECLVVRTFGASTAGVNPKLVVFVHGDVSAGGPADYMDNYAPAYATPGVVTVRLLRPGYPDSLGAISTGDAGNRLDTYTANNIQAVAHAIAVLRVHYKASRVVAVGHSGGAAILASALGKHPGIIDRAALLACPCDLRPWRPTWVNSQTAMDWASFVPAGTVVRALTGTADTQVASTFVTPYINVLAARSINATYADIVGATHSSSTIFTTTTVQNAISGLIN